jgi:hypothetical protein
MLEQLSKVIHEQLWQPWAEILVESEPGLSKERVARWKKECFMSYEELSEEMKDLDRQFAKIILKTINNETKPLIK